MDSDYCCACSILIITEYQDYIRSIKYKNLNHTYLKSVITAEFEKIDITVSNNIIEILIKETINLWHLFKPESEGITNKEAWMLAGALNTYEMYANLLND